MNLIPNLIYIRFQIILTHIKILSTPLEISYLLWNIRNIRFHEKQLLLFVFLFSFWPIIATAIPEPLTIDLGQGCAQKGNRKTKNRLATQ